RDSFSAKARLPANKRTAPLDWCPALHPNPLLASRQILHAKSWQHCSPVHPSAQNVPPFAASATRSPKLVSNPPKSPPPAAQVPQSLEPPLALPPQKSGNAQQCRRLRAPAASRPRG